MQEANSIETILKSLTNNKTNTTIDQNAISSIIKTVIDQIPDSPEKTKMLQSIVKGTALDPETEYTEVYPTKQYDQGICRVGTVIFVDDTKWDSNDIDMIFGCELSDGCDFDSMHDDGYNVDEIINCFDKHINDLQKAKYAVIQAKSEGGKYITYNNPDSFDFETNRNVGD